MSENHNDIMAVACRTIGTHIMHAGQKGMLLFDMIIVRIGHKLVRGECRKVPLKLASANGGGVE